MTPEMKLALVGAVAGLLGVAVAWTKWRLHVAKREDRQRERMELAQVLANAKTPEERQAAQDLIDDLDRGEA